MGLMFPSRKQYDSFTPRTGEYVREERRKGTIYDATRNSAGTSTLYTCPTGKRAKITYILHSGLNQNTTSQLLIAGKIFSTAFTTDLLNFLSMPYNDAVEISQGQAVTLFADAGFTGQTTGTVIVIEESAAPGYFVN